MLHALHRGLSEAALSRMREDTHHAACSSATTCGGKQLGKTKTQSLCLSLQDPKGSRELF